MSWHVKMLQVCQRRFKTGFILKEMEAYFHWAVVKVMIIENTVESSGR